MQGSSNRSVVIISGLLTLIVLGGATMAVAFRNGWLQVAAEAPSVAVVARAQSPDAVRNRVEHLVRGESSMGPSSGATQDEVGVYREKLEEAYRALDDAYAQIRSLQTAQTQLASRGGADRSFGERDGDHDRERDSRRRQSRHD